MNTIKFKTLLIAFLIGFANISFASNDKPVEKKEIITSITKDVEKLLKKSDLALKTTETATVKIMINTKNEIVVLSVDTQNTEVDSFVKSRLNYKKVSTKTASDIFTLPIKILAAK